MRTTKRIVVMVLALCPVMGQFQKALAEEKIVAVVNNEIITQRDLDSFLNFMRVQLSQQYSSAELETKIAVMKSDLLDRLIEDRLILQEAKRNKAVVDESRIKAKIEEVKKRYPSEREFETALQQQGLVGADLETKVREQQMMFNIVESRIRTKIVIRPSEITEYYNSNLAEFNVPEEREFESLVAKDQTKAKAIVEASRKGADTATLAKENDCAVSKFSAQKNGELKKEVEDILFSLKPGEVSDPVSIKGNFYVFRLQKINQPRQKPIYEVQDTIYEGLYEKKMQEAMVKWVDELKKKAYIKKY